jgi:hypothetical protein
MMLDISPREAKRAVNQRYSSAIAEKCAQHFGDQLGWCRTAAIRIRSTPTSLGRSTPQSQPTGIARLTVPEHQFKAEIQGHFSLTQDGRKLPNYSARSNYDDYAIGDGQGNRDGRLGIKLGQVDELQVIEAFQGDRHEPVAGT